MKWYKFWKKSGPNQSLYEDFKLIDEKIYSIESIELKCEEWAEEEGSGHNSHYSYGIIEIDRPPEKWLIRNIGYHKNRINNLQKELEEYEFYLNTYSRRVKIETIKKLIDNERQTSE